MCWAHMTQSLGPNPITYMINGEREIDLCKENTLISTKNLENANYYIPSFQQHLNIMQSTYKLLTSDFVDLK